MEKIQRVSLTCFIGNMIILRTEIQARMIWSKKWLGFNPHVLIHHPLHFQSDNHLPNASETSSNTLLEQRKGVRSPSSQEEGAAEAMCDELTAVPILWPLYHCWGGSRESGSKWILGRRDRWEEGVFKILFYFSLSYSNLIGNTFNFSTSSPFWLL